MASTMTRTSQSGRLLFLEDLCDSQPGLVALEHQCLDADGLLRRLQRSQPDGQRVLAVLQHCDAALRRPAHREEAAEPDVRIRAADERCLRPEDRGRAGLLDERLQRRRRPCHRGRATWWRTRPATPTLRRRQWSAYPRAAVPHDSPYGYRARLSFRLDRGPWMSTATSRYRVLADGLNAPQGLGERRRAGMAPDRSPGGRRLRHHPGHRGAAAGTGTGQDCPWRARVVDGRAAFRSAFCSMLRAEGVVPPGDPTCDRWLWRLSDEPAGGSGSPGAAGESGAPRRLARDRRVQRVRRRGVTAVFRRRGTAAGRWRQGAHHRRRWPLRHGSQRAPDRRGA